MSVCNWFNKKKKNKKYLAGLIFELLKFHTYVIEKVGHVYYISVLVYCKLKVFNVKTWSQDFYFIINEYRINM